METREIMSLHIKPENAQRGVELLTKFHHLAPVIGVGIAAPT